MNVVNELLDWLGTLPADFAFLLALPFAVAAVGLLADRPRRKDRAPKPAIPSPAGRSSRDALRPG
jgi:hypothetical protein